MASKNKVEIIGYLRADPVLRYLPDGTATVSVHLATNEKWKEKKPAN